MRASTVDFLQQLPGRCRELAIAPRCKTLLTHVWMGQIVWVVLLSEMPGKRCQAWKLGRQDYLDIMPKHGPRDRWVRENLTPDVEGAENPKEPQQLLLF